MEATMSAEWKRRREEMRADKAAAQVRAQAPSKVGYDDKVRQANVGTKDFPFQVPQPRPNQRSSHQ